MTMSGLYTTPLPIPEPVRTVTTLGASRATTSARLRPAGCGWARGDTDTIDDHPGVVADAPGRR